MAKQISPCVNGVTKKVKKVPICVGGVLREAKKGVCSVGSVVRELFSAGIITLLQELPSNSGVTYSIQNGTYDGFKQDLGYTDRLRIAVNDPNVFFIRIYGDFAGKSFKFGGQSSTMWSYLYFFDANDNQLMRQSIKYTSVITTANGTVPVNTEYIAFEVVKPDDGGENRLYLYELMVGEYDVRKEMVDILNLS